MESLADLLRALNYQHGVEVATIAKRNVELNGGTIDVRSERGTGTTVTITLPVT